MKHVKYLFAAGLFAVVLLTGCGVNKKENKSDKNYSEHLPISSLLEYRQIKQTIKQVLPMAKML